ncbi:MAG: hypothetical protein QOJ91_2275 [Sphingomonadales bacterium]|jgi:hypothetical protein|nr:hypothetical protein [Sphingomonadales bacterium]
MSRKEGTELVLRCTQVANFTKKAAEDGQLIEALGRVSSKEDLRIYVFKSRYKGDNNILKKVLRKRREGARLLKRLKEEKNALPRVADRTPEQIDRGRSIHAGIKDAKDQLEYEPDHITDAWGCRYVTLYQSEIPLTVSALLAELHSFNHGGHGAQVRLKEFVIYTNRPQHDPLSIVGPTKDALERSGFSDHVSKIREPENRKSAYSSVHLVFWRDVSIQHPGKSAPETELAAFEIQIRDIFEEGWGEVQHHLLYSDKENFPDSDEATAHTCSEEEIEQDSWQLHLNALKTFVDGCSQHASIIRREFDEMRRAPITTYATQSVTDRAHDKTMIIQELKRLSASETIIEDVSNGYTLLESGEQTSSGEDKLVRFSEASSSFKRAIGNLNKRCLDANLETGRPIRYYLSMEQANCQVSISEAAASRVQHHDEIEITALAAAKAIYTDMVAIFEMDAVSHIRLGKVQEKLASNEADLAAALAMTEAGIGLIRADELTGSDHWIAITSRIDKGFAIWRMVESQPNEQTDKAFELIESAAVANQEALEIWRSQSETARLKRSNRLGAHKAASNLLFFGGKLLEGGKISETVNADQLRALIELIESLTIEVQADYYKTRDNFLHAYRALGETDMAQSLAETNFRELRDLAEARSKRPLNVDSVTNFLKGSELRCFLTAQRSLFKKTPVDVEPINQ